MELQNYGTMNPRFCDSMNPELQNHESITMESWIHGSTEPWIHGTTEPWICGTTEPCIHATITWIRGIKKKKKKKHGSMYIVPRPKGLIFFIYSTNQEKLGYQTRFKLGQ